MSRILKQIHRWLGFPVGLLFLITFGTGLLTAICELNSRQLISDDLIPTELSASFIYRETTLAEKSQAITRLTEKHQGFRQIILPDKDKPYYQLKTRAESFTYSIDDQQLIAHQKNNTSPFFSWVLQLHRNFLLGKEGLFGIAGKHYVAWISLLALIISFLGLWLWWPIRKTFKTRHLIPTKRKRGSFYISHMTAGAVCLLVILLMSLTGASITYRSFTQHLLGSDKIVSDKIGSDKTGLDKITSLQQTELENNWSDWLAAAQQKIPDGKLINIQFLQNKQLLNFRFNTPHDWLGLANSKVSIDQKSSVIVDQSNFKDLGLGEKIISVLKPLHTGRDLPTAYILLQLVMSGLGVLMVFSGIASFVLKNRTRFRIKFFSLLRQTL